MMNISAAAEVVHTVVAIVCVTPTFGRVSLESERVYSVRKSSNTFSATGGLTVSAPGSGTREKFLGPKPVRPGGRQNRFKPPCRCLNHGRLSIDHASLVQGTHEISVLLAEMWIESCSQYIF
jgi:hypothetical protein